MLSYYGAFEVVSAAAFVLVVTHAVLSRQLKLLSQALAVGYLVELFSLLHPQIANYWHCHPSLFGFLPMINEEATHILFMYAWLYYAPLSLSQCWKGCSQMQRASVAALTAMLFFHTVDSTGVRYLFWVWHPSDELYYYRRNFVPWVSPFWVASSTWAISMSDSVLINYFFIVIKKQPSSQINNMIIMILNVIMTGIIGSILMVIPFLIIHGPIRYLFGWDSGYACLILLIILTLHIVVYAWPLSSKQFQINTLKCDSREPIGQSMNVVALLIISVFCLTLNIIGDPTHTNSASINDAQICRFIPLSENVDGSDCTDKGKRICTFGLHQRFDYICPDDWKNLPFEIIESHNDDSIKSSSSMSAVHRIKALPISPESRTELVIISLISVFIVIFMGYLTYTLNSIKPKQS